MTDEKLIEALRNELDHARSNGHALSEESQGVAPGEVVPAVRVSLIEAVIDRFEKAHTPTINDREQQGWREAELYASADGDARDDFMTGWRTADRLRHSEATEPSPSLMTVIEAAYNALHMETRARAVEILGTAIEADTLRELNAPESQADSSNASGAIIVGLYDERAFRCDCGRAVRRLWYNGGELDRKKCPCGIVWYGQHQETVLVKDVSALRAAGEATRG